jgi:hypothetical protein
LEKIKIKHMKTISLLAAMFLVVVLAGPAVASEQVPFTGSLAAIETDVVQGGTLIVDGGGVGNATQLGRYTMTFHVEVDLLTVIGVGTLSFVAANGDTLSASFIGQGTPTPDPNIFMLEEVATITGGTGRFAGAAGNFTIERVIDLSTGISSGSFGGMISHPAP